MELIADILLVAGALGAGLYCFVLSRRLKRFTDLEKGVGGAVAVLSTQADELKKSLGAARDASDQSGEVLEELTQRAESVAQRLELMMASMHDVVPPQDTVTTPTEPAVTTEDTIATLSDPVETTATEPEEVAEVAETPAAPEKEAPPAPTKRPGGLMFFRHDRSQGEATT
ncbi:hypothetical protein RUE5091_02986 [Ruegeria denitrificans]|uniref:Uncharacterized protein n=1 Tax=Ruegeria denitrificans TaxID=1715692 RepID=A0A0P1IDW2_9RHOB|nr:hypothetical protein [Ruegeria denitrificans]CUK07754.1 hypothetical protein RUE5091_02986 [Ruegeria denitrificans]